LKMSLNDSQGRLLVSGLEAQLCGENMHLFLGTQLALEAWPEGDPDGSQMVEVCLQSEGGEGRRCEHMIDGPLLVGLCKMERVPADSPESGIGRYSSLALDTDLI